MPLVDVSNTAVLITTLVLGLGTVLLLRGSRNHDPREPPLAAQSPPLIGHLLGLLRHGNSYLELLTDRTRHPIFTVPLPGSKMYLVRDPDVAALVHRHARTLTFAPITELQTGGTCGIDAAMWERLNPGDAAGTKPVSRTVHKSHHANMAPVKLRGMHERSFAVMAAGLNEAVLGGEAVSLRVGDWLRSIFTRASASAMYGEKNPVSEDETLIEDMENFEHDEGVLFLGNWGGILQPLLAPKGYKALQRYKAAFERYYNQGLASNASALIQDRLRIMGQYWDRATIASLDILMVQAALMNMKVMTAWMIWRLYADAQLLADIRDEVGRVVARRSVGDEDVLVIDGSRLLVECPLLVSTWMESLRYYGAAPSARFVSEDTVLDNGMLLKKGCVVQVMGGVLHTAEEFWGPTVAEFEPRRFLRSDDKGAKGTKRNKAFMPFGGGIAWCPGRHYVSNEVLSFVTGFIMAFDLEGADGGPLFVPEYGAKGLVESIRPPKADPLVRMTRRPEFASTRIALEGGEGVSVDFAA